MMGIHVLATASSSFCSLTCILYHCCNAILKGKHSSHCLCRCIAHAMKGLSG